MHARHQIPSRNPELAVVLHGSAARAALEPQAHRQRFAAPNGSQGLIEARGEAGARLQREGHRAVLF